MNENDHSCGDILDILQNSGKCILVYEIWYCPQWQVFNSKYVHIGSGVWFLGA